MRKLGRTSTRARPRRRQEAEHLRAMVQVCTVFVHALNDADRVVLVGNADGHADEGLGAEACLLVKLLVEAWVLVRVRDVDRLVGRRNSA